MTVPLSQTQQLGCSYEDEEDSQMPWGRLISLDSSKYSMFELSGEEITFGRDPIRCDYELAEPQISGIHTKIIRKDTLSDCQDGSCGKVKDLSTNGTFINKHKIGKNKERILFDGDEITFIQYAKMDKKTKKERKKVSFLFYKNRELDTFSSSYDINSIFNKYALRSTLGTGSFAVVKLGVSRETGEQFAVKQIDKKKYEMKSKSRKKNSIMNEVNILKQIDHPNIIKIFDVFDENATLYLVLEMASGGELFSRIIENKKLTEDISRNIMNQLLSAIMYLHDNKIAHRDLKPENILMVDKESWNIKITDFGLSRLLEYDYEALTTMCGTPLFLAPEVLSSRKLGGYSFSVDYWSIGVILYLMLVGHPPYNEHEGQLLELVKSGKFSYPSSTWSVISPSAKDLVQHLMEVDVNKRYNGEQTLKHPWMNSIKHINNTPSSPSTNKLSGRKRKSINDHNMNDIDTKEYEPDRDRNNNEPARKKYKNNYGHPKNANLMSVDPNSNMFASNLTPFDSLIEKNAPKKAKNNNINVFGDYESNDEDPPHNGNGASFILKNSKSMKEMSLDN